MKEEKSAWDIILALTFAGSLLFHVIREAITGINPTPVQVLVTVCLCIMTYSKK